MVYIIRQIQPQIQRILEKGKSVLLLGPRQSGKTTLLEQLHPDLLISFIQPRVRLRYEVDPSLLADEVEALAKQKPNPLVIVDEVQKIPLIMDVVQDLIDRKLAQFILTGSSARKLKRRQDVNLLPGRVIPLHMDALTVNEIPENKRDLNSLLLFGSLPEILLAHSVEDKEELLNAYVTTYLEEEVRAEALVRNLASFARFLEMAASESGYIVNASKLSQQIGVAHTTIVDYYQILEDCLIVERIEPYTKSKTRHRLCKSKKYLFFDLGVRRLAANEGKQLPTKLMGHLFEQFIGLELIRYIHLSGKRMKLYYWQDLNGPEVDWLIEFENKLIPIEVKYTDRPTQQDAKHLLTFLNEYDNATQAYLICQTPRPMQVAENVLAVGWGEWEKFI